MTDKDAAVAVSAGKTENETQAVTRRPSSPDCSEEVPDLSPVHRGSPTNLTSENTPQCKSLLKERRRPKERLVKIPFEEVAA